MSTAASPTMDRAKRVVRFPAGSEELLVCRVERRRRGGIAAVQDEAQWAASARVPGSPHPAAICRSLELSVGRFQCFGRFSRPFERHLSRRAPAAQVEEQLCRLPRQHCRLP